MEINIFSSKYSSQNLNEDTTKLTDIYYPCLVTTWKVSYKSFFKKPRNQKRLIFTNLIKGDSSFGNEIPTSHAVTVQNDKVMNSVLNKAEALAKAEEMLRRYYMHYVRVWNIPNINCLSEKILYFPYTVLSADKKQKRQNQLMLYEPVSNLMDKLEKFPEIEQFYKLQQRG